MSRRGEGRRACNSEVSQRHFYSPTSQVSQAMWCLYQCNSTRLRRNPSVRLCPRYLFTQLRESCRKGGGGGGGGGSSESWPKIRHYTMYSAMSKLLYTCMAVCTPMPASSCEPRGRQIQWQKGVWMWRCRANSCAWQASHFNRKEWPVPCKATHLTCRAGREHVVADGGQAVRGMKKVQRW